MAKTKLEICKKCWGTGHLNGGDENSAWSKPCEDCHGIGCVRVPITNADRIRAMSDEELAQFLNAVGCPCPANDCRPTCEACIAEWIKQPVEEENHGKEET